MSFEVVNVTVWIVGKQKVYLKNVKLKFCVIYIWFAKNFTFQNVILAKSMMRK